MSIKTWIDEFYVLRHCKCFQTDSVLRFTYKVKGLRKRSS